MFNTVTSLVLIIITIGVAVGYISPAYNNILELRAQNDRLENSVLETKDINEISKNLTETMRSFPKEDTDRLDRLLPQKFDELRFLNGVDAITKRNNVAVKSLAIETIPDQFPENTGNNGANIQKENYASHTYTLNVTSTYELLLNLLKDLERSLQFIDITSVKLSTGGTQTEAGTVYNYTIGITTYSIN